MSALGQKQTCAVQEMMSALPPKADMCSATGDVRFRQKRTWLESKPRHREINACDHCHRRNDQYAPCPEPTQTIWQKRRNYADNERTHRGGTGPSVPIHFGR